MGLKNVKQRNLVWPAVFVLAIGALAASYLIYQSNTDTSDTESTRNVSTQQDKNQKTNIQQQDNSLAVEQKESTATVITTGDSEFGSILFDGQDQAIYIWEVEESAEAECYDGCAVAWPPVLTDGAPQAKGGVNSDLLGTTKRTDGSTQVTYDGHPLYYYEHEDAGEVKCHNVSTHGGLWWVVQPDGSRAK